MNNKNRILIVLTIAAIFVAVYLFYENSQNKKRISELEEDKLKLILDSIKRNPDLSEEIKLQIEKLIKDFENIDTEVSNELAQALQLLQIGQTENAIEDLVKIIEHLLKTHYKDNKELISWLIEQKKKSDLHNLLEFCKHEEKISEVEFRFFVAIKTIRNKEDHTLDLKLDDYINASGLITAIGGIFKLASIVYPNNKKDEKTNKSPAANN